MVGFIHSFDPVHPLFASTFRLIMDELIISNTWWKTQSIISSNQDSLLKSLKFQAFHIRPFDRLQPKVEASNERYFSKQVFLKYFLKQVFLKCRQSFFGITLKVFMF